MRLFTCGLSLALLSSCLLGLSGCGEDNQSDINKQASKTSGEKVELTAPQPQDQREFGDRSKSAGGINAAGYPKRSKLLQGLEHE